MGFFLDELLETNYVSFFWLGGGRLLLKAYFSRPHFSPCRGPGECSRALLRSPNALAWTPKNQNKKELFGVVMLELFLMLFLRRFAMLFLHRFAMWFIHFISRFFMHCGLVGFLGQPQRGLTSVLARIKSRNTRRSESRNALYNDVSLFSDSLQNKPYPIALQRTPTCYLLL